MKKKLVILLVTLTALLSLVGCDADKLNETVNEIGDVFDVDVGMDVTQEEVDDAVEKGKSFLDKTGDVLGSLMDYIEENTSDYGEIKEQITDESQLKGIEDLEDYAEGLLNGDEEE